MIVLKPNCIKGKSIPIADVFKAIGYAAPLFASLTWYGQKWPVLQEGYHDDNEEMCQLYQANCRMSPAVAMMRWVSYLRRKDFIVDIPLWDISATLDPVHYPVCWKKDGTSVKKRQMFPNGFEGSAQFVKYSQFDARNEAGGLEMRPGVF